MVSGTGINGNREDPLSGTVHSGNGYRAYNPVLMRFAYPDSLSPFGVGSVNAYAYCLGDPVNHADPSGHMSVGQSAGMAVGLLTGMLLSIVIDGSSAAGCCLADGHGGG